ncbi:tryptophan-rich sensory protein [Arenibacter sp. BSSL-BM3]|uniref:Tryptophan-rich sensory protein n=1 Tax=Arenibacter arenosicollis TaxID=2762274 RepID=A0ABR7QJT6_9FLAO|nr:tryptophan-rich sensory protein [Arenibacter arenosicollis]MBC8767441.1 tryptophan-rich sensory protein [Arenibacter arenosicollis]
MQRKLSIINLLSVVLVIAVNYISQAVRINDTTIGELSQRYSNLFTPASYAFAIWGLIFLSLLAYALFQVKVVFYDKKELAYIEQTGYWFAIANVLNALWVIAFAYDYMGLTVIIIVGILISLLKIIINTNMERWDAPKEIIVFSWWPICLYSGWITVATIANIALYLTKIGWDGAFLTEVQWTMVLIVIATLINLVIIYKRNMREFAAVGVWALFAIYIRHQDSLEIPAYTALACSAILLSVILFHGYSNRKSNPFFKL